MNQQPDGQGFDQGFNPWHPIHCQNTPTAPCHPSAADQGNQQLQALANNHPYDEGTGPTHHRTQNDSPVAVNQPRDALPSGPSAPTRRTEPPCTNCRKRKVRCSGTFGDGPCPQCMVRREEPKCIWEPKESDNE
jgi:hypothetical protein